MTRSPRAILQALLAGMLVLALALSAKPSSAQYVYGEPRFDPPALDAMLAPVALYPDPLLSQVLMAATYRDEVEEAARWLREHPELSGDEAERSAYDSDWDPSVRSLLAFPMLLQTLADYPSWTSDLGEAFLVQREDVMDSIQRLRRRALAAGTLRSTDDTRVVDTGEGIIIESVDPQAVYVPYYDPQVTYGTWWWSGHPPMHWPRWPGYHARPGRDHYVYWGPGVRLGSGFFFGRFVWPRREVRIMDVRPYYYPRGALIERHTIPGRPHVDRRPPAPGLWRHDEHRRGFSPHRDRDRDRDRPVVTVPRQAPIAPPRNVGPGRSFDDRGGPRDHAPRRERGTDDRRGSVSAPPRGPAPSAAAPLTPRTQGDYRSRGQRSETPQQERRGDDRRHRQPPAMQAPITTPRTSATPPPQRNRGNNDGQPRRRERDSRD